MVARAEAASCSFPFGPAICVWNTFSSSVALDLQRSQLRLVLPDGLLRRRRTGLQTDLASVTVPTQTSFLRDHIMVLSSIFLKPLSSEMGSIRPSWPEPPRASR